MGRFETTIWTLVSFAISVAATGLVLRMARRRLVAEVDASKPAGVFVLVP